MSMYIWKVVPYAHAHTRRRFHGALAFVSSNLHPLSHLVVSLLSAKLAEFDYKVRMFIYMVAVHLHVHVCL